MASPMHDDHVAARQRILFVTGMLGAGKTSVLNELEDLGWEAIDNFPIRLIGRLIGGDPEPGEPDAPQAVHPLAVGFDCRTRDFVPDRVIAELDRLAERPDLAVSTLFLDCAGHELQRRFEETRRRHILAQEMPVTTGIAAERELIAELRERADMLIDTTHFSVNELKQTIRSRFVADATSAMTVTITSFGYARGMPPAADLVFDMRYLDNPHWDPALRELTGLDAAVGTHISSDPAFQATYGKILALLRELLPLYARQGKSYVSIALGCTGGKHRSVFVAEQIGRDLRDTGFSPTILHRNLTSRSADMIEASQANEMARRLANHPGKSPAPGPAHAPEAQGSGDAEGARQRENLP